MSLANSGIMYLMAKSILVANWKNHPSSIDEVRILLSQMAKKGVLYKKLSLFIAPPLPYFESVKTRAKTFSSLASQDIFVAPGASSYTSQVTPDILKSFGVKLSIIGHSERRALGESSVDVSKKVRAAISAGIIALVCVGESSRDKDGLYYETLRDQIKASLADLNDKKDVAKVMVAYEPVWAIGKGAEAIDPTDLSQSVIFIRKVLTDMFGRELAQKVSILYGGSVDASNAPTLVEKTGIKGFLVGRASLKAKDFRPIAEALIAK